MTDSNGRGTNLIFGPGDYVQGLAAAKVDFVKKFYEPSKLNLMPRFGFAFDPDGKQDAPPSAAANGLSFGPHLHSAPRRLRVEPAPR